MARENQWKRVPDAARVSHFVDSSCILRAWESVEESSRLSFLDAHGVIFKRAMTKRIQ